MSTDTAIDRGHHSSSGRFVPRPCCYGKRPIRILDSYIYSMEEQLHCVVCMQNVVGKKTDITTLKSKN